MTKEQFIQKIKEVNAEAHTKEVWAVAKKLFGTRIEAMYELVDDQSDSDEPLVSYENGKLRNYDESDIDSDFFSDEHDSPRAFGQITGLLEPIENAENWSKQDYFTFGYSGFGGHWFYNNIDGSGFEILGDYKKAIAKLKELATQKAKNGANIGGNEYDTLTSRAYELADMLDGLNPSSHRYKVLSQEMEEVRDRLDEIEEDDNYKAKNGANIKAYGYDIDHILKKGILVIGKEGTKNEGKEFMVRQHTTFNPDLFRLIPTGSGNKKSFVAHVENYEIKPGWEKAKNGANIGGYEAEFQKLKGGERDLYGMFKDEILSEEDDNFEGWYKNFTNTREPDTNKTIFKVWQEVTGTKPTKETFKQLWNHFKKNKQAKNGANISGKIKVGDYVNLDGGHHKILSITKDGVLLQGGSEKGGNGYVGYEFAVKNKVTSNKAKNGANIKGNNPDFDSAEEHAAYIEHLISEYESGSQQYTDFLNVSDKNLYTNQAKNFGASLRKAGDEIENEKDAFQSIYKISFDKWKLQAENGANITGGNNEYSVGGL